MSGLEEQKGPENQRLVVEAEARAGHVHHRSTQIPRSLRTDSE